MSYLENWGNPEERTTEN